MSQLIAPFTPFIAEEIYQNLTGEESVHLAGWPDIGDIDEKIIRDMEVIRKICELGHAKRKELSLKVRQPLAKLIIKNSVPVIEDEMINLIKDELNIKKIVFEAGKGEMAVDLDINITKELKEEGEARDIVREIQKQRKTLGTALGEKVSVTLQSWPTAFEGYIKKKASVDSIKKGEKFSVLRK
jgi:isoleucyl-tRNA synthetase